MLHAFWNASSLPGDFIVLYLTTQVPLFLGFIFVIIGLRRAEQRLTQRRLDDDASAGGFTTEEAVMLAAPAGRKAVMRWAAELPGDRHAMMRSFIGDATALGAVRQRAINGHVACAAEEHALLVRTRITRARLLAYRARRYAEQTDARRKTQRPKLRQCLRVIRALSWLIESMHPLGREVKSCVNR